MTQTDFPPSAMIHAVQSGNTVTLFKRARVQSTSKNIHKFICAFLDPDYGPQGKQYSAVTSNFGSPP